MSDQAPLLGGGLKGLDSGNGGEDKNNGKGLISTKKNDDSDNSSSIGVPSSDSNHDNEDDDVQSKDTKTMSSLDCLAALEKSLPMKRGLSSHYDGKSKSFGSLTDLTSIGNIKEIVKEEHIANKKRRIYISKKLGTTPIYDGSSSATADKNEDGEDEDNATNDGNDGQEPEQDQEGKSEN